MRRVDLALRARDHRALDRLLADLPRVSRGVLATLRASLDELPHLLTAGVGTPRLPVLRLPRPGHPVLTIGRDRDCDLVLSDSTVSRLHAVLRLFGDQWFLDDLGSTNGTRVNGIRIRRATPVQPRDRVGFGAVSMRVDPAGRDSRTRAGRL